MHLNDLSVDIKKGVQASDLVGLIFNTIGVSDGISYGYSWNEIFTPLPRCNSRFNGNGSSSNVI